MGEWADYWPGRRLRWWVRETFCTYERLGWLWCLVRRRHLPERDQCGRPEHDFCIVCGKSMPGEGAPIIDPYAGPPGCV